MNLLGNNTRHGGGVVDDTNNVITTLLQFNFVWLALELINQKI